MHFRENTTRPLSGCIFRTMESGGQWAHSPADRLITLRACARPRLVLPRTSVATSKSDHKLRFFTLRQQLVAIVATVTDVAIAPELSSPTQYSRFFRLSGSCFCFASTTGNLKTLVSPAGLTTLTQHNRKSERGNKVV